MAVQGHAKGVPVKDVGSMEYGAFGGKVEGHAKPVPVDWTPQTLVPKESKKPEIVSHATPVPVDWTPHKGYEKANTPMSDRAVKQSQ